MKDILITCILIIPHVILGQTSFCPNDPPINPFLADSPYPVYHRNGYGQASTCLPGLTADDEVDIKVRRDITGGTSPWIYLSERYPNGEQAILYSNATHVFKFIDNGDRLIAVDSLRLDFNTLSSNGYNHILAKDRIWYSYEPTFDPDDNKYSQLFKFSDALVDDPYSEIIVLDTFDFADYGINRVNMYNLNYNGEIIWYSEREPEKDVGYAGIIDENFNLLDTFSYPALPNERINHNSISVDEENNFYIVTSHRLIQFSWDGIALKIGWEARYDFVNDGPTGNFAYGSGTTPTLMGWGAGNDKLVVVADGHAQNNLVAFWRELPEGWTGVQGQPLHFADAIEIPNARSFSNLFQSIENSPTAYGYEIAIAQFNGFLGYDCDNLKGVQKFSWNTDADKFELEWVNNEINMNGVLAYSSGTNLVYGSGKEIDCNYYYYGLNWDNGNIELRLTLGEEEDFPDDPFYDQGVNHIIDEQGNMYYSGSRSLIKLEKTNITSSVNISQQNNISVYPNPAYDILYIDDLHSLEKQFITIYDILGQRVTGWTYINDNTIDISALPSNTYFVHLSLNSALHVVKFIKM